LQRVIRNQERLRLSAHLYDGVLVLIYRNIPLLALCLMVVVSYSFNQIAFANVQLLVHVLVVALVFRNGVLIARLVLLERLSDV
jgi:potassium efflux system protein